MKKYINTVSFSKISVFVFMLLTTLVNAQTDPTDLPEAPDDTVVVPIDGYVWVLAALGLVYVFLRLRALSNRVNTPNK